MITPFSVMKTTLDLALPPMQAGIDQILSIIKAKAQRSSPAWSASQNDAENRQRIIFTAHLPDIFSHPFPLALQHENTYKEFMFYFPLSPIKCKEWKT
jgi:hypothetical protein